MWAHHGKRVYKIDASQSIEEVSKQIDVVLSAYFSPIVDGKGLV